MIIILILRRNRRWALLRRLLQYIKHRKITFRVASWLTQLDLNFNSSVWPVNLWLLCIHSWILLAILLLRTEVPDQWSCLRGNHLRWVSSCLFIFQEGIPQGELAHHLYSYSQYTNTTVFPHVIWNCFVRRHCYINAIRIYRDSDLSLHWLLIPKQ